jgi:hypothetical protein
MAMVQYGPYVTDVRKKIAGVVHTKSHSASVMRKRVKPRNPRSADQLAQRSALSGLAKRWGSVLTDVQRTGWEALAALVVISDRLGNHHHPTGMQLYERDNLNEHTVGHATIDAAPADQNVTALTSITPAFDSVGLTATIAYTATPAAAGTYVVVFASGQNSPGRNTTFGSLNFIFASAAAAASPANIFAAYTAKYGALVQGKKIRVKVITINGANGAASLPLEATAIVA